MNSTNIIEEDKKITIPQNVMLPAYCEKKSDRILAHTLPQDPKDIEDGIM